MAKMFFNIFMWFENIYSNSHAVPNFFWHLKTSLRPSTRHQKVAKLGANFKFV